MALDSRQADTEILDGEEFKGATRVKPGQTDTRAEHRSSGARPTRLERTAEPADALVRGWNDLLFGVLGGFSEDRILANAAAVAFFVLLALFPAIAALVSIYGMFADPSTIAKEIGLLTDVLPGGAISIIRSDLTRLSAQGRSALGIGFLAGLVVSLWSAHGGMSALFAALNVVFGETEKRSFVQFYVVSLAFTVAMIGFLVIAIVAIVAVPVALGYLPGFIGTVINIARWPLLAVLVTIALALIYRYGPSRTGPRCRWISWGSAAASVAWLITSALFSYYAASFGTFNKTYGSLGAVIGFMMWIWLSVTVILLGGKLNAELGYRNRHRRLPAGSTTRGPSREIGGPPAPRRRGGRRD